MKITTQWTVPQLSIMIIYNSTLSILIQWIRAMIVNWQSDLVITKESLLSVCDKPYNMNKRKVQKGEEIKVLQNCALYTVVTINNYYLLTNKLLKKSWTASALKSK